MTTNNLSISRQSQEMQKARKAGVFFSSGGLDKLVRKISSGFISESPVIYDPTCGHGYLLKAFDDIPNVTFIGNDIDPLNIEFIATGKSGFECKTNVADALEYRPDELVDVVVMNPPFSIKWDRTKARPDLAEKWTMPPNKAADWAFILNAFETLSPNGVLVAIVPSGPLTRKHKEAAIRKEIVERGHLRAVVALPGNLFEDTQISVWLVILTKQKNESVVLADGTECFERHNKKVRLSDVGIGQIADTLSGKGTLPHATVTTKDIESHDWGFLPRPYIVYQKDEVGETPDIGAMWKELRELNKECDCLMDELEEMLQGIIDTNNM